MTLQAQYLSLGASLATDGIPLHFGDLKAEYHAALEAAVLLDRSHEARIELEGADRFDLLNRISTNDVSGLQPGHGITTILTNSNARILDRVVVINWSDTALLLVGGPGRTNALFRYLQRNVFFRDRVSATDISSKTCQFALHGTRADEMLKTLVPDAEGLADFHGMRVSWDSVDVFIVRLKPLVGTHWAVIIPVDHAEAAWHLLLDAGRPFGLRPSGGLLYNVLRIRAGHPGVGHELSEEFIPLELGLWDEVSFKKGCYTGQEIIARMESRNKLARMMVRIKLDSYVKSPIELFHEGRRVGILTSSVLSPDEEIFAIGVVKSALANAGQVVVIGRPDGERAYIQEVLGVQPTLFGGAD